MANALDAIKSTGKLVGYIRVSSIDQNTERQLEGIALDKVFTDKMSGENTGRPQLQACLSYLREDDTLLVHSMDRLARNVDDLRRIVRELVAKGVTVRFLKENLTFSNSGNTIFDKLMLTMLGAFAEFERELSRERRNEGIALAKAKGVYKGRKRSLSRKQLEELYAMVDRGEKKTAIAAKFGLSRGHIHNYYMKERDKLDPSRTSA